MIRNDRNITFTGGHCGGVYICICASAYFYPFILENAVVATLYVKLRHQYDFYTACLPCVVRKTITRHATFLFIDKSVSPVTKRNNDLLL